MKKRLERLVFTEQNIFENKKKKDSLHLLSLLHTQQKEGGKNERLGDP